MGGSARTEELTLPGFKHDPYSSVYPLGVGSPLFHALPLGEHGLQWVHSPAAAAHPLPDGPPALMWRSFERTAASLQRRWRRLPFADRAVLDDLGEAGAGDPRPAAYSASPAAARPVSGYGRCARWTGWCSRRFSAGAARALIGGSAAHTGLPLGKAGTAAFGLVLHAAGHAVGWPIARGGAGAVTGALASYFRSLGGEIETNAPVRSLDELPRSRTVLFDLTARQIAAVAGPRLGLILTRSAAALPLRRGRVQSGLGAGRPHPLAVTRMRASGDGARGGQLSGAAARGAPGMERPLRRAPLRAAGPAEPVRPLTRAGGQTRRLGVLPRSERFALRHDGADRAADRALRPGVPGPDSGATRDEPGGAGAAECQPDRRRREWRCAAAGPDLLPPRRSARTPTSCPAKAICSCAPRRRHPVGGCTGCAATTRLARRWRGSSTGRRSWSFRGC